MRRFRVALAVLLSLGSVWLAQLGAPRLALACSCVAPDPGAPVFTGAEEAVFVGRAGQPLPDGTYRFAVELWFKGGTVAEVNVASEREVMPGGETSINTCGLHFEVGDRLIMAAAIGSGRLTPALCSPHAVVASEEGERLIAAATATFGEGRPPGQPPPEEVPDAAFSIDLGTIALVVIGAIVVLSLAVVLVAIGRGSRADTQG